MKTIETTREQFHEDLSLYATQWVTGRQERLAEQVEEIWDNKQIVFVLNKWAEMKREIEAHRKLDFAMMLAGEEPFYADGDKFLGEKCCAYYEILTEIFFG